MGRRRTRPRAKERKDKSLKQRFHGLYNEHHLWPRSRGGSNSRHNVMLWLKNAHNAWHVIFRHMKPQEIHAVFDNVWYAIFNPSNNSVLPTWLRVCPFSPAEQHIPTVAVDVRKLAAVALESAGHTTKDRAGNYCRVK